MTDIGYKSATARGPLAHDKALALAQRVMEEVHPYAARAEIAGSIRRGRDMCGDIDIVVLPRPGADLGALARRLAGGSGLLLTDGRVSKRLLLRKSGVQCDLWIAHHGIQADLLGAGALPPNFGALLMTYTGSVSHNIRLVAEAKARGWEWRPQTGLVIPSLFPDTDAPEIVCACERAIYERLGLPWMEPHERDAWGDQYRR